MKKSFLLILGLLAFSHYVGAISLPQIFSDHMVLQADATVKVWGWGKAGEPLQIRGSWSEELLYDTKIEPNGYWETEIATPIASYDTYQLVFTGYNEIVINDILMGEVWLCSGQSNMEWSAASGIDQEQEVIETAVDLPVRFFKVAHKTSRHPQDDVHGEWVVLDRENVRHVSAIGYFFGHDISTILDRPIGIIQSAWGGTPAEIWMSAQRIADDETLSTAADILEPVQWGPHEPGMAYHAMIYPLAPYRISGVLWYQGESNVANANTYGPLLSALISDWRDIWGYEFPFYLAQIAPYRYGDDHVRGAIVRDQQRRVLDLSPNTQMVVVSDIGNIDDIHPRNKKGVAQRFARIAKQYHYGLQHDKEILSPQLRSFEVKKNKVVLHFDHAQELRMDGELGGFELVDRQGEVHSAEACIKKNTVEVKTKGMDPLELRFAMTNIATTSLRNEVDLPASSFQISLVDKE